ncbi:hypothetical protein Rsub_10073 [Raphidocelis subcapitata]|uniref:Uncharacterized protein n=1 Tax=Raphidocelis subcapitata TaxID=307507 RepID=A0A2V0PE14_9CHLO|nr:hypothetical protein Rsub_10073 [Raphidocelis subcapitata]|eukprot:GBF97212.1 hypothetical protein Rsub_10073 [Raphidocelis subcapitata]
MALVVLQATYCGLQLVCGGMLAVAYGAPRPATRYILLGTAAAGLTAAAAPLLLLQLRGPGPAAAATRRGLSSGGDRLPAAAAARLLLAALFAVAATQLITDAGGGTCALNGGLLPAGPFGLEVRSRDGPDAIPMAASSMLLAPWGMCIAVDLSIASGAVNAALFAISAVFAIAKLRLERDAPGVPPVMGTPIAAGLPQPAPAGGCPTQPLPGLRAAKAPAAAAASQGAGHAGAEGRAAPAVAGGPAAAAAAAANENPGAEEMA